MERFVQFLVAGGVVAVAGLWLAELSSPGSTAWLAGAALVVTGIVGLVRGIGAPLDPESFPRK
ncbi:MAG: hypothetical protein ABEH56_00915 [Salinirussus sp.]